MCFKKISQKVSRMYQESLNEVSFAILLHESHRSYPSRRRACFKPRFKLKHFFLFRPMIFLLVLWHFLSHICMTYNARHGKRNRNHIFFKKAICQRTLKGLMLTTNRWNMDTSVYKKEPNKLNCHVKKTYYD